MYKTNLGKEDFKATTCCRGEQLEQILYCISEIQEKLVWYGFDVQFSGKKGKSELFSNSIDKKVLVIGDTANFIDVTKYIHQFDSGVFIAFSDSTNLEWDMSMLPETEENEGIQHSDGKVEIRAFDYAYFEIY